MFLRSKDTKRYEAGLPSLSLPLCFLHACGSRLLAAIFLSAGLALIIGYYFWFLNRRTGGVLPEDNPDALISDGAGELGFYSPHSWWPLPVGLAATAAGVGLIIGWWLTLIAVGALIISVMGFVLEYERPSNSPYGADLHH
jgi:hypothetical protein